ncbi:MAG: tetratricopeptide repeat protein [Bacteroidota bacterium]
MSEGNFGFLLPDEFNELNQKYEAFKQGGKAMQYFEVSELEVLLDQFLDQNETKEVKALLMLADKMHPDAVGIKIRKAKYLFSDGKITAAWNMLKVVEAIEPSRSEVSLLKGMILVFNKQFDKAELHFNKAIEMAGEEADEMFYTIATTFETARQFTSAVRYFEKAYKASGGRDPELLYDLAYCHEKAGNNKLSVKYYHKYLNLNPFSESAWYNLGVNYNNQDDCSEALEAFDYALTIKPDYIPAIHGKAQCLANLDEYEEAVAQYEILLQHEDGDAEIYYEMGEAYRKSGDADKAMECFEKSQEIDAEFSDTYYGMSLLKFDHAAFLESIYYLKTALNHAPYNPDYWYSLGMASQKMGFDEDAEHAFEKALQLYPYDPDFWLSYADMEFSTGKVERAIELLMRGETYNHDTAQIKYRLAAYHLEVEDKLNAISYFTKAVELNKEASSDFFEFYPKAQYLEELRDLLRKNS